MIEEIIKIQKSCEIIQVSGG